MIIKFLNNKILDEHNEPCNVIRVTSNIIKIITKSKPNLSGFKIYFDDDMFADYSDYTNLYSTEWNGYMLTNLKENK